MAVCTSITGNLRAYLFGGVTDVEETDDILQGSFNDDLLHLDLENIFWNTVKLTGLLNYISLQYLYIHKTK